MGTAERGARLEPASQQGTVEGAGLLVLRSPPRPLLCPQGPRGRARVYSAAWPVSPAGPSARHGPCGRQGPEHLKPRRPRARKLLAALPARTCSAGWPHARRTSTAATATSQGGSPTRRGLTVAPRCWLRSVVLGSRGHRRNCQELRPAHSAAALQCRAIRTHTCERPRVTPRVGAPCCPAAGTAKEGKAGISSRKRVLRQQSPRLYSPPL